MKIDLTDNTDNSQKNKLNQWFDTCRFVYNKCVQWCRDKGYQLGRQDLRDNFKTIEFAKKYKWFYTKKFWDVYEKDGIDSKKYKIYGYPTVIGEKNGKQITYEGSRTEKDITEFIKEKLL